MPTQIGNKSKILAKLVKKFEEAYGKNVENHDKKHTKCISQIKIRPDVDSNDADYVMILSDEKEKSVECTMYHSTNGHI